MALDEYRFQVTLNWNRTQYYLVLNVAILTVASGTLQFTARIGAWVGGGLFTVGMLASALSIVAVHVQHGYYREVRRHKARVEDLLGLRRLSIVTTPGMADNRRHGLRRLSRVTTLVHATLALIGVLDLGGLTLLVLS